VSNEKTSLTAAIRHLAEQDRRTPADHATPGELAAYNEGTLPPPVEARVREHLAHCRTCSDLLLDLAGFADLAPPPGVPELTDAEVEQDWQKLRGRLGGREEGKVVPFRPPVAVPTPRPSREFFPWRVAAAAALVATVGLSVRVVQLTHQETKRSEVRVVAPSNPEGVKRGEEPTLKIPVAEDRVLYLSPGPEGEYHTFQVDIVRSDVDLPDEQVVQRTAVFEATSLPISLFIPAGSLKLGSYKALLYGIEGGRREHSATLAFEVDGP
jgi:hypothetical protein